MYRSQPFTDRRQRRDTPARRPARPVLVGEKDFFNPVDPADYREYLTVLRYGRR